jgi:uncharacterized protein DUF3108
MSENTFFKIAGIISMFIVFQLLTINLLSAQDVDGMLIFQVDGNRYMRKNFDKNGKLKNYQTIEVGKTKAEGDKIEAKMTVITYEVDGTLKDASQSNLVCNPKTKQVLMGIFPFAGGKSKKSLVVEMDDGEIMYPSNWRQFSELKDFNFSLNFSGGAAGFFGTKSDVSISNRKVMKLKDIFGVSGKLTMKAYVLGIRIAKIEYDFYEEIDVEKGIISQKFTEKDGDYFTTEIIN